MSQNTFGNFDVFCRETTLPVCNLLSPFNNQIGPWGGCELRGIPLSNGQHLGNLGAILLAGAAIATSCYLLFRSERKRAAVGRREMQLFLCGYIVLSICEIVSIGEFPASDNVRLAFGAVHIGAIAATTWALFLNGIVGFQLLDDGTPTSIALVLGSSLVFLIGVGYIALDTGFEFTTTWSKSVEPPNYHVALYVLYLLVPLIWIVLYFVLELVLVLRILGEHRPLVFLVASFVLFAVGQIFNFVVSSHICNGTSGAIDGSMFQTLFTLAAVVTVWLFWSSITEDDWPANPNYAPQSYP